MLNSMRRIFLLGMFIVYSLTSLAAQETPVPSPQESPTHTSSPFTIDEKEVEELSGSRFYQEFINMLLTLGLLVGLLIGASWFMKRMMNTRLQMANDSSLIKIIEQRALSQRTTLHLIDLQGSQYLIAETQNALLLVSKDNHLKQEFKTPSSPPFENVLKGRPPI
jgi:flagellar biogenesis protein FliO